jgi:hypothetical protein
VSATNEYRKLGETVGGMGFKVCGCWCGCEKPAPCEPCDKDHSTQYDVDDEDEPLGELLDAADHAAPVDGYAECSDKACGHVWELPKTKPKGGHKCPSCHGRRYKALGH